MEYEFTVSTIDGAKHFKTKVPWQLQEKECSQKPPEQAGGPGHEPLIQRHPSFQKLLSEAAVVLK